MGGKKVLLIFSRPRIPYLQGFSVPNVKHFEGVFFLIRLIRSAAHFLQQAKMRHAIIYLPQKNRIF